MKNRKKQTIILTVIVFVLLLGLGYAYLNSNLSINGTTNITSSSWNVYWNNVQIKTGSVTDVTTPATIQSGNTLVVFNVDLKEPGDYYEFTVDAVNNGSIDAMIGDLTQGVYASNGTTPKTLPDYLEYTVTYSDGLTVTQNDLLPANSTETYKVRVYFKEDITASQLPSTNDSIVFKFGVEYVQANSNATVVGHPRFVYAIYGDLEIGGTIPNNANIFNDYNSAITYFGHDFFIRHKAEGNLITESYVGFVYNNNVYYLRGAGATYNSSTHDYNDDSPYYNSNKEIATNAFGSSNCYEANDNFYSCSIPNGLYVEFEASGLVIVMDDEQICHVYSDGMSWCGE